MPYIGKVFEWVKKEAMTCALLQASKDEWEVEHDTASKLSICQLGHALATNGN